MELTLSVYDRFCLYSRTFLSPHHEQVVNLLYQPIIGMKAVNLYFTFWRFFQIQKDAFFMTHKQLLTFFDYDVNEFEKIRHRLEGIDLLHVYYHQQEGYYLYELRQPLTSRQFFRDSNLNIHLLYRVGYDLYEYLEKQFVLEPKQPGFINLTKSFNEVYPQMDQVRTIDDDGAIYVSNTSPTVKYPLHYPFDFELFLALLNKNLIAKEAIDEEMKERILQEAALFNFDAEMMSKVVIDCATDGQIDPYRLHETAREYYRRLRIKGTTGPVQAAMTEEEFNATVPGTEEDSRYRTALKHYKTKTPHQWLYILLNHSEVPVGFLDVVHALLNEFHLPVEVINVLLEFTLHRTGRLPLEYCRMVAASWSFKRIKTAEQAMEAVSKIIEIEEEYKKEGKLPPTYARRRRGYVAREPEWLASHEAYRKQAKDEEIEVDLKALQDLLSSFK